MTLSLGVLHVAAMIAVAVSTLPLWMKWVLAGAVLLHGGGTAWFYGRVFPYKRLRYDEAGGDWRLTLRDGSESCVQVLPGTVVQPGFVLLHLQAGRGRHHWLILRDSLPADDFRRLRVTLRIVGAK